MKIIIDLLKKFKHYSPIDQCNGNCALCGNYDCCRFDFRGSKNGT